MATGKRPQAKLEDDILWLLSSATGSLLENQHSGLVQDHVGGGEVLCSASLQLTVRSAAIRSDTARIGCVAWVANMSAKPFLGTKGSPTWQSHVLCLN